MPPPAHARRAPPAPPSPALTHARAPARTFLVSFWFPWQQIGVLALLRPLLLDTVPTVQHTAALALGRLANCNDELAAAIVSSDILPQLVYSLAE